jgi:HD-like signal output (HDOD) protein
MQHGFLRETNVSQKMHEAARAFRHAVTTATVGELNFPTSLAASQRVLAAIDNSGIGLAALGKIIVAEPLLSAKVIRLANSVALNPANTPVRDIRQAVLCVGIDLTRALAMVLMMEQLRQAPRHGPCRDLANRLWERSIHVAALSYVLARKLTRLNADEVMFAAIVHDLGRFYLLSRVADYPALLDDPAILAQTINDLAGYASAMVLDRLKLPAAVVDTILAAHDCNASMPPQSATDILFIARAISPRRDPFQELDERRESAAQADGSAALGIDQRTLDELIAESGDEIHSIIVALES